MKATQSDYPAPRVLFLLLLAGVLSAAAFLPARARAVTPHSEASPIRILQASEDAVIVEFTAADYESTSYSLGGETFSLLTIPGTVLMTDPGKPQAPTKGTLLALPTTEGITLEILESEVELLEGVRLPPAPQFEIGAGLEETDEGYLMDGYVTDAPIYAEDADYPPAIVTLGETGMMRDQAVTQVQFYPVQTNPVQARTKVYLRIVAKISWQSGIDASALQARPSSPPFEQIYNSSLLNYGPGMRSDRLTAAARSDVEKPPKQIMIVINSPGMYRLDAATIAAQLGVTDPSTVTLRAQGKEVPMYLDDGDLLFYGRPLDSHYAAQNVYFARAEPSSKRVVSTDSVTVAAASILSSPHTVTVKEDAVYWQNMRARNIACEPSDVGEPASCFEDRWFWHVLNRTADGSSRKFSVEQAAANVDAFASELATITVNLRGYARSYHDVTVRVHGLQSSQPSESRSWYGQDEERVSIRLGHDELTAVREVEVVMNEVQGGDSADRILVNDISIDYRRQHVATGDQLVFTSEVGQATGVDGFSGVDPVYLWDITDPDQPSHLRKFETPDVNGRITFLHDLGGNAERSYLAARPVTVSACNSDAGDAACFSAFNHWAAVAEDQNGSLALRTPYLERVPKYVVIASSQFMEAAENLAAHHANLAGLAVNYDHLVKSFGYGIPSPFAIQRFVAAAKRDWGVEYVVLMGDATLDFRNRIAEDHPNHGVNHLPTFSFESNYFGEIANDNWYGQLAAEQLGPENLHRDRYQDVIIGRLPVSSAAEAMQVVGKIVAYAELVEATKQGAPRQGWQRRVLVVADDEQKFEDLQSNIQAIVPPYYLPGIDTSLCTDENCYTNTLRVDTRNPQTGPATDNEIVDAILKRINEGVVLINYSGHGDVSAWGRWDKDGVSENKYILHSSDLVNLSATAGHPFISVGNCLNGAFAGPTDLPAFAERWLQGQDRGAIGYWAPSGLGYPSGHELLLQDFVEQLYVEPKQPVGAATLNSLNQLVGVNNFWRELVDTYILFGDPAMELAIYNPPYIEDLKMTSVNPDDGRSVEVDVLDGLTDPLPLDTSIMMTMSRKVTVEVSVSGDAATILPPATPNTTRTTSVLGRGAGLRPAVAYTVQFEAPYDPLYDPRTDRIDNEPLYIPGTAPYPTSYTFVTMDDGDPPTVTLNVMNDNIVPPDSPVRLLFSEPMRHVQRLYETNASLDPAKQTSLAWSSLLKTANLMPENDFERNLPYTLRIGEYAFQDIAGNPVAPLDLSFEFVSDPVWPFRWFLPQVQK